MTYESSAEEHPTPYVIYTGTAGKSGVHYHTARPNGSARSSGTDLQIALQFQTVANSLLV
jgi:hypothetical protein